MGCGQSAPVRERKKSTSHSKSIFPSSHKLPPPWFSLTGLNTPAYVHRVVDGDTIDVSFPFRGEENQFRIRLVGIDTPELRPRKKHRTKEDVIAEKEAARIAKEWVHNQIIHRTIQLQITGEGKYAGRWLGVVRVEGRNLNEEIVELGLGVEYHGGKKPVFGQKKV